MKKQPGVWVIESRFKRTAGAWRPADAENIRGVVVERLALWRDNNPRYEYRLVRYYARKAR